MMNYGDSVKIILVPLTSTYWPQMYDGAMGADFVHHITACPPGFENLTASLNLLQYTACKYTTTIAVKVWYLLEIIRLYTS